MRRTKAEVGIQGGEWSCERDGARYEGEVIQLLSNLGATLLGGEPVDGVGMGGGKGSVLPGPSILYNRATIK